jgi:hypothetical protein
MSSKLLVFSPNTRLLASRRAALVLLSTTLLAGRAGAQEGTTIAVDCSALDAESRAAVEARARADLLVRNAPGTFVVVCVGAEGRLSWHPLAGVPVTTTVSLDADPRTSVDRILERLGELVTAATTSAPAEAAPPGDVVQAPDNTPPVASAAPPAPPPPPPGSPPLDVPSEPAEAWRGGFRGVSLGGGVSGELWSGAAALGPRASVLMSLPARFQAGAAATVLFTLSSPDQVSGRMTRVALTFAYGLDSGERFRVGADFFVDLLHAAAPNAGSANSTVFGALVRATAALVTHPIGLEFGPTLAIHPTPVQAQIGPGPDGSNGSVPFRVQTLTGGIVLDVLVGPL